MEQGVFDRILLAERAIVPRLLLALENQIKRIELVDLLRRPLGKIGNVHLKFHCGISQRPPLLLQALGSGQEAMLPACCIV